MIITVHYPVLEEDCKGWDKLKTSTREQIADHVSDLVWQYVQENFERLAQAAMDEIHSKRMDELFEQQQEYQMEYEDFVAIPIDQTDIDMSLRNSIKKKIIDNFTDTEVKLMIELIKEGGI